MSNVTTELLAFIDARNAKSQAWVNEKEGRWSSSLVTDPTYWAESGIFTVEDFERDELHSIISDASKEANGCRTRINPNDYTLDELREMADYYSGAAVCAGEAAEARENQDLLEFQAKIQSVIELGAGDEETAIRWLTQDEEFYNGQDVDQWVWNQGILFTDYGRLLCERLRNTVVYN